MKDIVVDIRRYEPESQSHEHDYHQIVLPVRGCLELQFHHGGGRVADGLGALIVAGQRHAFRASTRSSFVVLDVPSRTSPQWLAGRPGDTTFFPVEKDVRGLLDYLTTMAVPGPLSGHLRSAWLDLLIDRLPPFKGAPDPLDLCLRRATAFMKARLADPIRTSDIAAAAGISLTRLHAAFRDRLTSTPHAHLVSLRLDAAEHMLATTRHSIAEIALRTGHADQSALTRALRRQRGRTPAEVRRARPRHDMADEA